MKKVFVLQHSYEKDFCEETKFIGVYSSIEKAESAIERLKIQPGFRDRPEDFQIEEYELDKDQWTEGYAVMTTVEVKDKDGKWMTVQAEELNDGNYQIIENYDSELLGEFKNLDIVKCEERESNLYAVELVSRAKENNA